MACTCHLKLNRPALREVLGVRELLAASKVVGQITANVGVIWKHFTTAVYEGGDLPVIATREALQNSLDAIRSAIKAGQIGEREGQFSVTWDPAARSLTWEDNGIGMDAATIQAKFLSLGDSGKRDGAGGSEQAAGGFGVAKAVILGVSPTFRWEMHTRDNLAHPEAGGVVPIDDAPFRQGTRITVYDIDRDFDNHYDYAQGMYLPLLSERAAAGEARRPGRLETVLASCDLPHLTLLLNGERVEPLFNRRGGSKVSVDGSWGPGVSATVKAYRRADRGGAYYVRLGGLYQFHQGAQRPIPADIVIDLTATQRPGEPGYPLTAARTSLQGTAANTLRDLVREIEKENESLQRAEEYEIYEPSADPDAAVAEDLRLGIDEAMAQPDLQAAMSAAAVEMQSYYQAAARGHQLTQAVDAVAPAGSREEPDNRSLRGLDAAIELTKTAEITGAVQASPDAAVQVLEVYLGDYLATAGSHGQNIQGLLDQAKAGQVFGAEDTGVLEVAIQQAADHSMAPGGAGLLAVSAAPAALAALSSLSTETRRPPPRNPFGRYAGFRVSKKNYESAKAYRFKKNFARWVPYLILWDLTLRMVARVGRIRDAFTPGFVLDDTLQGLAAKGANTVVYINPDRFRAVVVANRHNPAAIAYYLHGVAGHELAHVEVGLRDGHGEEYVAHREDLAQATAALLTPIAEAAVRIFKLTPLDSAAAAALRKAEQRAERCQVTLQRFKAQQAQRTQRTRSTPPPPPLDPRRAWAEAQVDLLAEEVRGQPDADLLLEVLYEQREALIIARLAEMEERNENH